jgi:hydroxyethylthiazole kinase
MSIFMAFSTPISLDAPAAFTALHADGPLVQCITNSVVTNFTANVLLAVGAAPAMCDIPGEAGVFAGIAHGVLVNLGTPTAEQRDAAREAVQTDTPWVLDPVAVGALPVRTALAHELIDGAHAPAIIRGNASEIMALSGHGAGGRGVDSTDSSDSALSAARDLASRLACVVAVSGETDYITDGVRVVTVSGGSDLLTRTTGAGCSLGAVMTALVGVTDPLSAAVTASAMYAVASERAADRAKGPGSFAVALIDELAALAPSDLAVDQRTPLTQTARIQEVLS